MDYKYCYMCGRKCDKFYQLNGNLYECFEEKTCKLITNRQNFINDGFKKSADELCEYYQLNKHNKIKKPFIKIGKFIVSAIFFIPEIILNRTRTSKSNIFFFV